MEKVQRERPTGVPIASRLRSYDRAAAGFDPGDRGVELAGDKVTRRE